MRIRKIHINVGGWIINYGKPFFSRNIKSDRRFQKGIFNDVPVQSVIGIPLISESITIGALLVIYKNKSNSVKKQSLESLEHIALLSAPFLRNTQKIREYFDSTIPETSLLIKYKNAGLFGKSEKFIELLHSIEPATKCDVKVLLVGNTGTGKTAAFIGARRGSRRSTTRCSPFTSSSRSASQSTVSTVRSHQ